MPDFKKTILVADHDRLIERTLVEHSCGQEDVRIAGVTNAMDALGRIHEQIPDVVCMAADLCGGDGWTVARLLRSDERFAALPIVMIISSGNTGNELQAQQLGLKTAVGSDNVWAAAKSLIAADQSRDATASRRPEKSEPRRRPFEIADKAAHATSDQQTFGGSIASESLLDFVFSIMEQDEVATTSITMPNTEPRPWVLCIDDDRDYSVVLTHRLHSRGVDVINAFDGTQGVKKACGLPADVILLDYNMPNGTGEFVLKELKQHPATKDIPVIVVTGNKNNDVRRMMLGLGADEFLSKPVPFAELFDVMSRYITVRDAVG